jgi:hypothetical protein
MRSFDDRARCPCYHTLPFKKEGLNKGGAALGELNPTLKPLIIGLHLNAIISPPLKSGQLCNKDHFWALACVYGFHCHTSVAMNTRTGITLLC